MNEDESRQMEEDCECGLTSGQWTNECGRGRDRGRDRGGPFVVLCSIKPQ